MATVKVKYRPSIIADKEGVIYYQIIHKRVVRQIRTDYHIFKQEWDGRKSRVIIVIGNREEYLITVNKWIIRDVKRINFIIGMLESSVNEYLTDDIVEKYQDSIKEQSFYCLMDRVIAQLIRMNKDQTAANYTATLKSFMRFRNYNDVSLDEINSDLMVEYEAYLKGKGIVLNTVSFYMRILRAVYNRAVKNGLTEQHNPFKYVYTGIARTVKRALSLKDIKQIKNLDLSKKPTMDFARDMFMFSFYTRGMSFIDMAYLKKRNLHNGILSYYRRKTGQQMLIKWEKCMQDIIDKYSIVHSDYLLPIIKKSNGERQQYRNALHLINNKLKEISVLAGFETNLTMYVSRHSWASAAKNKNIPISIISEGMGHNSERITQIYLASLDTSLIDKANITIIEDLF
ncbi:MAG: site-specific integrase [Prevotella sp.]|nr:site-specific integrase [Prevotella sp.]